MDNDENQPRIERYVVDKVVDHTPGRGRKSLHNYKYRLRLKGYGPESDVMYRADEIPQCHEMISAYRSKHGLDIAPAEQQPSKPQSTKLLKRKRDERGKDQSIRKRTRHHQKKEKQSDDSQRKRAKNANTQRKSKRRRKANRKYISNVNKR